MAPIKFEEQIKDKLDKRTVVPSSQAWSKLSDRLDAEEKRNKTSIFWWFGIAASIAVLVMISVSYFVKTTESKVNDIIVKDDIKDVVTPVNTNELIRNDNKIKKQEVVQIQQEEKERVAKQPIVNKEVKKPMQVVAQVEEKSKKKMEAETIEEKIAPELITAPEVKFNSVANVVRDAKAEKNTEVIDKQIDSLLKAASQELIIDRALKKKSSVVNADALLQDVEEEMGQSFRTRIYETLKNSYKSVKSAVAQRND